MVKHHNAFKQLIYKKCQKLSDDINAYVAGDNKPKDTWQGKLIKGLIAIAAAGVAQLIATLIVLGVIAAIPGAAIIAGVAVAGLVAGLLFHQYQINQHLKKYKRAAKFINDEQFDAYVERVLANFMAAHAEKLAHATPIELEILVRQCMQQIEATVMQGRSDLLLMGMRAPVAVSKSKTEESRVADHSIFHHAVVNDAKLAPEPAIERPTNVPAA